MLCFVEPVVGGESLLAGRRRFFGGEGILRPDGPGLRACYGRQVQEFATAVPAARHAGRKESFRTKKSPMAQDCPKGAKGAWGNTVQKGRV